jgi:hypothetical protein
MCILKEDNMKSEIKPDLVETYVLGGIRKYYVNIDVAFDGELWSWEEIHIPDGHFEYAPIVDALIQFKYPIDKMQAVINNYLLDPEDAYAIDEFNKMQAWRKEAKEIAKEALDYELHNS